MAQKELHFIKMHGCGNDYIYFNCFEDPVEDPAALSKRLSDRHKGVGGDGVILVCPPENGENDGRMRMFNLDGSEGKMCGNGIRCVAKLIYDKGLARDRDGARKKELKIETKSGVKICRVHEKDGVCAAVTVDMGAAVLQPGDIPVRLPGGPVVNRETRLAEGVYSITCVSMGNPHCVIFGEDPDGLDLEKTGPKFERDPLFPEGVNTEFVQVIDSHTLKMRVWERGSGETMACGTGSCAVATAAVLNGFCPKGEDVTVRLRGGDLVIRYTDETVWMTGEAVQVFEGKISN